MDDEELLREYVEGRSERAFAALVERHLPLVHGAAMRVVGEGQAAQDVAQGVFIDLARGAGRVRAGQALPGWLYRAAYRRAINVIRGEQRRRQREAEAMKTLSEGEFSPRGEKSAAWEDFAPMLEEAMAKLGRVEQDAVVLRFFQGKSLRETGAALAMSEEAARKRVSRGLEKMRGYFAKRGVTASAALLAEAISVKAAPAVGTGLAAAVTEASLAGGGAAGGLAARMLFMTTNTKIGLAVAMVALAAIPAAMWWREQAAPVNEAVRAVAPVAAAGNVSGTAAAAVAAEKSATDAGTKPVAATVSAPAGVMLTGPAVVHEGVLTLPAAVKWVQGAYMAAGDWENAGIGTPEDALQTLLWAKKTGNKDVVAGMTVQAAPVVVDLDKGEAVITGANLDLSNASVATDAGSGKLMVNAGGNPGPMVVTPGTSPYDPGVITQEALANGPTRFVPATAMAQPLDYSQITGGTIVSQQEISPSEVQFNVDENWPAGSSAPDTQTQTVYDFTLDGSGWKYTQHTVSITGTLGLQGMSTEAGGGGTSAGAGQ